MYRETSAVRRKELKSESESQRVKIAKSQLSIHFFIPDFKGWSMSGVTKDIAYSQKGMPTVATIFQSSAHVTYTSNSLAKTKCMAKPKFKKQESTFHPP